MRCRYKKDVVHHINAAYRHQKDYNKISQESLHTAFLCVTVKPSTENRNIHILDAKLPATSMTHSSIPTASRMSNTMDFYHHPYRTDKKGADTTPFQALFSGNGTDHKYHKDIPDQKKLRRERGVQTTVATRKA